MSRDQPLSAPKKRRTNTQLTPYTAADLQHLTLPPIRWVIDSIIAVGLWLLAGPPKTGKSYLILGLCHAIATGGIALGSIRVDRATVLYLALEDNQRRVRYRLDHITTEGEPWPDNLHVMHAAPKLDTGLLLALEDWLDQQSDCKLIVLDTLARIRGQRNRTDDAYTGDSKVMEGLQEIAMRREIAIIVVHHVRKAPGSDIFETVSGTYGLTGPTDGMLVLQRVRGEADAKLHITGRDVEERELALKFNARLGTWEALGDAKLYAQSTERRTILTTLQREPGLTPKAIAEAAGMSHASVKHLCIRMRDEALLRSDANGRYYPVHPVHPTEEHASSTAQSTVNGTPLSRSPVHPTLRSLSVNGVNDRYRQTITQLLDAHENGRIADPDVNEELSRLFARSESTAVDRARLIQIAKQVLA